MLRGPLRGRAGWIAGDIESRTARGITKALVHAGDDVELLETKNLESEAQLPLLLETKKPAANTQVRSGLDTQYSFAPSAMQKLHNGHDRADHSANKRYSPRDLRAKPNDPFGLDQ